MCKSWTSKKILCPPPGLTVHCLGQCPAFGRAGCIITPLAHKITTTFIASLFKESALVRPFVRLSVRLFTFEVLFKLLFVPTSQSWMSNNFRFRILREKYWKEVVSDLKFFNNKGCKIAAQFFCVCFSRRILPYWPGLFWYLCYHPDWSRDSLSPVWGIFKY